MQETRNMGQARLISSVIHRGLCTGCGACTYLCPYMRNHKAQTVALFDCDRETGRCYRYCPRTQNPGEDLPSLLFDSTEITGELGPFRGLYMTRAKDPGIRKKAQHGGTVTALIILALDQGLIEACVVARQDEQLLPESFTAFTPEQVLAAAGSKFGNAPSVGEFNRISLQRKERLGVVATPCQALALARMKAVAADEDKERMGRLKLVIGLFCGWTLDWIKLNRLVRQAADGQRVRGLDIPPSRHACMQVTTDSGIIEIPIDQVNDCVRECCEYCTDMTAEFADISVGSARSRDGWEEDRHWNQVIVRSRTGERLLDLARQKGVLEFKEVPPENLANLKRACAGKKSYGHSQLNPSITKEL